MIKFFSINTHTADKRRDDHLFHDLCVCVNYFSIVPSLLPLHMHVLARLMPVNNHLHLVCGVDLLYFFYKHSGSRVYFKINAKNCHVNNRRKKSAFFVPIMKSSIPPPSSLITFLFCFNRHFRLFLTSGRKQFMHYSLKFPEMCSSERKKRRRK